MACNVARGNAKGRVEKSIGYIQKHFLGALEISSLEALNAQARRWTEQVANVRLHREMGKRPCDLFEQEKATLQPLPLAGYDILTRHRALVPLSGQLHLTRGAGLLQLEVQQADCSRYQINEQSS